MYLESRIHNNDHLLYPLVSDMLACATDFLLTPQYVNTSFSSLADCSTGGTRAEPGKEERGDSQGDSFLREYCGDGRLIGAHVFP